MFDQSTGLSTAAEWIKTNVDNPNKDEQDCMLVRKAKLSDGPRTRAWSCEMRVVPDRALAIQACAYLKATDYKLVRADLHLMNTIDITQERETKSYLLFPGCNLFRKAAAAKGAKIKEDEEIDYIFRLVMGPDEDEFEWCLRMEHRHCGEKSTAFFIMYKI